MGFIRGYNTPPDLNTPTPLQAEASAVQRNFEAQLPAIRANTGLSSQGKMLAIIELYVPAYSQVARIQRDERDRYQSALERTERALFGTIDTSDGADVIATRDAFDRIEQIAAQPTTQAGAHAAGTVPAAVQAKQLLDRAQKTGDHSLTRAIVATAIVRNWGEVLAAFTDANSDLAGEVDDYRELRKYDPSTSLLEYYTFQFKPPFEIANIPMNRLEEIASTGVLDPTVSNYTTVEYAVTDHARAEYQRMQAQARGRGGLRG